MFIGELLLRKDNVEDRIRELENGLEVGTIPVDNYSIVLEELKGLYDTQRQYVLILNRHNTTTKITVGTSEISIADALILRGTVNKNIELLETMLIRGSGNLALKNIIDNKKKLIEEYMLYTTSIKQSDWTTEWEEQS